MAGACWSSTTQGDRKDGTATAHVGWQWLGRLGKTDNGVVTVATLWADERLCCPLHARPCTPARHFPRKRNDPDFRTRPQLATDLAGQAHEAGFTFRAVVADCGYGGHDEVRHTLREAGLPFVMALKPRRGTWACKDEAHTPVDAARALTWTDPERPGDWAPVVRTFRDGHTETWWAADARLGGWGPDGSPRPVVAVVDPGALPEKATWYPAANLSRPGSPRTADSPHPPAGLAQGHPRNPGLARPLAHPASLLACLVETPPPPELQALITSLATSQTLDLY
ncbi:transposase [Streptomyces tanashiensis]